MSLTSFFTIVCFFEIDVLVCILFPVQFSKIMCTSAVLIYITKYFPLRQLFFLLFFIFFTVYAYTTIFKKIRPPSTLFKMFICNAINFCHDISAFIT